jgi:hypothetical protein
LASGLLSSELLSFEALMRLPAEGFDRLFEPSKTELATTCCYCPSKNYTSHIMDGERELVIDDVLGGIQARLSLEGEVLQQRSQELKTVSGLYNGVSIVNCQPTVSYEVSDSHTTQAVHQSNQERAGALLRCQSS